MGMGWSGSSLFQRRYCWHKKIALQRLTVHNEAFRQRVINVINGSALRKEAFFRHKKTRRFASGFL